MARQDFLFFQKFDDFVHRRIQIPGLRLLQHDFRNALGEPVIRHLDLDQRVSGDQRLAAWEAGGFKRPRPEEPEPFTLGHTHAHDHGICLDPWLVDHVSEDHSVELVLQHELAHAIAGTFGHEGDWFWMCEIIGYELTAREKEEYEWQAWAEQDAYG